MPRSKATYTQIALRLPSTLLAEVDDLARRLAVPGVELTRSDVLRRAIISGLEVLKEEAGDLEKQKKR